MCAMFYFSLKCYSEDIDKEALLSGTPMYIREVVFGLTVLHINRVLWSGRVVLPCIAVSCVCFE